MSDKAEILVQRFLELSKSKSGQEMFGTINELMEALEKKDDPEMTEVHLVESMTSFIEKFQTMNHNLNSYATGKRTLLGDKLTELYDEEE